MIKQIKSYTFSVSLSILSTQVFFGPPTSLTARRNTWILRSTSSSYGGTTVTPQLLNFYERNSVSSFLTLTRGIWTAVSELGLAKETTGVPPTRAGR